MKGKLEEQLKTANQILTLAELARKMETEQEKVQVRGTSAISLALFGLIWIRVVHDASEIGLSILQRTVHIVHENGDDITERSIGLFDRVAWFSSSFHLSRRCNDDMNTRHT